MRPCIVGIGGAGGNILRQFLQSQDINLMGLQFGRHLAYGEVKGLWLESATQDTQRQNYYGSLASGRYPPFLICHGNVSEGSDTRRYLSDTYGFDLKAPGFDRRAEYLKGIFEVFEIDPKLKEVCLEEFKSNENPLSGYMWQVGIRPNTIISTSAARSKLCDSILFIASLGGGTGTGFINPITSYVRSEEPIFPIFALGILTEKGTDERKTTEGQRDLGAVIAMYDLLTKASGEGIDALILVDNQTLVQRFGGNETGMNVCIYNSLKPLLDLRNYPGDLSQDDSQGIRRVILEVNGDENKSNGISSRGNGAGMESLLPPILVPCYCIQPAHEGNELDLVEGALGKTGSLLPAGKDGRLFPCDPTKADRVLVFTRGFFRTKDIKDAVKKRTGLSENKIMVYRKLGGGKTEDMLILLRNPYGGSLGEHKRPGTLEWRLHDIISESINYIENNEMNILGFQSYKEITKEMLRNYFYGKNGLQDELHSCLERLRKGEAPVFTRPLRIFGNGMDALLNCQEGQQLAASDRASLRKMVKEELREIFNDQDCRRKIREILHS